MCVRIICTMIFLSFLMTAYAQSFMVTCKGENSHVETNEFMKDKPLYSHISFKLGNLIYESGKDPIRILKNEPFSAIVEKEKVALGYYIPIMELNSGSPLLRGKIFFLVTENGRIINEKSGVEDAICTIRSYGE
jgi:hypothetical protein